MAERQDDASPRLRGPYKKRSVTRERIVDAAITIFAANGFRNGSTAKIAALAGISEAQIYYHFANKVAVLEAVLARRDRVSDEVARPDPGDPRDIPFAILRIAESNETIPEQIRLYTLLAAESTAPGHPAHRYFRDRYRRLRAAFADSFTEMELAGLLRPGVNAAYAAASTLALWDGIQVQWLTEPQSVNVVQILRRHLGSITRIDLEAATGESGPGSATSRDLGR